MLWRRSLKRKAPDMSSDHNRPVEAETTRGLKITGYFKTFENRDKSIALVETEDGSVYEVQSLRFTDRGSEAQSAAEVADRIPIRWSVYPEYTDRDINIDTVFRAKCVHGGAWHLMCGERIASKLSYVPTHIQDAEPALDEKGWYWRPVP